MNDDENPRHQRACPCGKVFSPRRASKGQAAIQRCCSRQCAGLYRTEEAKSKCRAANRLMRREGRGWMCACRSCIAGRQAAAERLATRPPRQGLSIIQRAQRAARIRRAMIEVSP